jgi:hypothetical protein
MTREMSGKDIIVGEIPSSFGGDNVEVVVPVFPDLELAVARFAREYCVPGDGIIQKDPKLSKDPIKAARNVQIENYHVSDQTSPEETLLIAAAKVETAEKNLDLSPKQKEHYRGVKENFIGAWGFYSGPAEGIDSFHKSEPLFNGKFVKNAATSLLVLQMAASCNKLPPTINPTDVIPSITPIVETATPTPTATPEPTSTVTPEPTPTLEVVTLESLTDINKDFTPEQIASLESQLSFSIGPWNKNKKYDSRDGTWSIQLLSSGKVLDLQKSPLLIPVSENENMKVFVAVKSYYLDSLGKAQELLVPFVIQMPDGQMFVYGFDGKFVDWTVDDNLLDKAKEEFPTFRWFGEGYRFSLDMLTNDQISQYHYDVASQHPENISNNPALYTTIWISKYNSLYSDKVQKFMGTGKGLSFIVPFSIYR